MIKYLFIIIFVLMFSIVVNAKPQCRGFNNYDNKVTIVFTDGKVGESYVISDVKLIPNWRGKEYKATSVKSIVKNGIVTATIIFPNITQFSHPKVTLRINGKKSSFKICQ